MNNNKREITILNKVEFPKNLEYICQNFFFFPSVLSHCNKDLKSQTSVRAQHFTVVTTQHFIKQTADSIPKGGVGHPPIESQPVLISPFYTFCLLPWGLSYANQDKSRTHHLSEVPTPIAGFFSFVPFFKGFFPCLFLSFSHHHFGRSFSILTTKYL